MRHLLPKIRHCCILASINILVLPFLLHFFKCDWHTGHKSDRKTANDYLLSRKASERNRDGRPTDRTCRPKHNIVFLKTHKTGGSTVTNILNRYGEYRGLTFILPRIGENRLDWPWFFQRDSFYTLNGSEPNILSNHARYNRETMSAVMPNNTVYVTILRDPIAQFESSFSYMTLDKILGMKNSTNPIEEFFKDPESVLVNYVLTQDLRINSDRLKLIRNGMFYDLGLESKDFDNKLKIRESIDQLDNQFDLVMLMEYFDESLVLLKRLMCWDIDDIVYFRLKQRASDWKRNISKTIQHKIHHWSNADIQLYHHFNRTFWLVVKNLGQDFWDEVKLLRAKNKILEDLCLHKNNYISSELLQTAETKQFRLRYDIPYIAREMCKRMTWDEIKYLKYLREIHIAKIEKRYQKHMAYFNPLSWISSKIFHS